MAVGWALLGLGVLLVLISLTKNGFSVNWARIKVEIKEFIEHRSFRTVLFCLGVCSMVVGGIVLWRSGTTRITAGSTTTTSPPRRLIRSRPGCVGSTASPRAGDSRPSRAAGPYAIITNEGVPLTVRAQPDPSAAPVAELAARQLVRLQCTLAHGPAVPAPRALGAGHSTNVWDQLVDPAGWIPDSFLATYRIRPVAPRCG